MDNTEQGDRTTPSDWVEPDDEEGRHAEEGSEKNQGMKERGEEAAERAKAKAKEALKEGRAKAEREMDRGTSWAGERTLTVAKALRSAADDLDSDGEQWLADYTRKAATQIDRMSGYLHSEDASSMMADLEETARSNPATFVGSTFAAGLAVGRFLRSSKPGREPTQERTAGPTYRRKTESASPTDRPVPTATTSDASSTREAGGDDGQT